ncbi:MAG TPA: hypothetical protein PKA28_10275 [Methylomusa anaerophila]|uniref:Uncharacterized protein n=1 Tax=Methylomusa anaerophila TaxID=1930071 RepID=A0A348AHM6_9FIRM|nr:hypothetical protein [Methylomusa anaerophila]BBB90574.1 hypothetical protein MAMMFC1_01228 [Methylomusa anaerophila]HML88819.1 hypothetical protein [Methylomusa anaerophila]
MSADNIKRSYKFYPFWEGKLIQAAKRSRSGNSATNAVNHLSALIKSNARV